MANGEYGHIEIPADDPVRAKRFHGELFGWEFQAMEGFPDYFLYGGPGATPSLGGAIGRRGQSAPERVRNYITVDSLDDALGKVERLGGRVVEPKREVPGQGWYAVVQNTEGNEQGLWESLAGG